MTTFPLTRRVSMFLLSQGFFIVANKVVGIVKVLDIIPPIPFRFVLSPANEIFNPAALIFLYYLLVKETIYLKGFGDVDVIVNKHGGKHLRMGQ